MDIHSTILSMYHGTNVPITGNIGFNGGLLALLLSSLGAKVIGFSLDPPTEPSFFHVTRLSAKVTGILGDILDLPRLSNINAQYLPDFVSHLSSQPPWVEAMILKKQFKRQLNGIRCQ